MTRKYVKRTGNKSTAKGTTNAKKGNIKVTRNIRAVCMKNMKEPITYPKSGILYFFNVKEWCNKMGFYEKIEYSFGVPSTQKPVYCDFLKAQVMHYERTCQGIYYCPHAEKQVKNNHEEMRNAVDYQTCTVRPCKQRHQPCTKHATSLKKSGGCKFKLHFYVPIDKTDDRRLLLCLGKHSHALLGTSEEVTEQNIEPKEEESDDIASCTKVESDSVPETPEKQQTITKAPRKNRTKSSSRFAPSTSTTNEEEQKETQQQTNYDSSKSNRLSVDDQPLVPPYHYGPYYHPQYPNSYYSQAMYQQQGQYSPMSQEQKAYMPSPFKLRFKNSYAQQQANQTPMAQKRSFSEMNDETKHNHTSNNTPVHLPYYNYHPYYNSPMYNQYAHQYYQNQAQYQGSPLRINTQVREPVRKRLFSNTQVQSESIPSSAKSTPQTPSDKNTPLRLDIPQKKNIVGEATQVLSKDDQMIQDIKKEEPRDNAKTTDSNLPSINSLLYNYSLTPIDTGVKTLSPSSFIPSPYSKSRNGTPKTPVTSLRNTLNTMSIGSIYGQHHEYNHEQRGLSLPHTYHAEMQRISSQKKLPQDYIPKQDANPNNTNLPI